MVATMKIVILSSAAAKQLDALPPAARDQVVDALSAYALTGIGDVKRLSGRDGYRLRVGRYRVLFSEDRITVLAVYIGKRETTTYGRN